MGKYLRVTFAVVLALAIILSCTVVGNKLTDPATYSHTIEVLDHNRTTVLGLTAASAAASAAISALPDDVCSPIAQEISEFTTYFMMILSVIFMEKYLLTLLGAAVSYILFPVGFGALLVNCFFPKEVLKSIGTRLVVFGFALVLVIPASIWASDQINATYAESIEMTIQSASAVSENLIGGTSNESAENTTVIDEAKEILGDLSGSVAGVIEQFKNLLNRFIEATAVMLVTTCLIPILVVVFFVWLIKILFNIQITPPAHVPKLKKLKQPREEGKELMLPE